MKTIQGRARNVSSAQAGSPLPPSRPRDISVFGVNCGRRRSWHRPNLSRRARALGSWLPAISPWPSSGTDGVIETDRLYSSGPRESGQYEYAEHSGHQTSPGPGSDNNLEGGAESGSSCDGKFRSDEEFADNRPDKGTSQHTGDTVMKAQAGLRLPHTSLRSGFPPKF
jgi:hypothetical protein